MAPCAATPERLMTTMPNEVAALDAENALGVIGRKWPRASEPSRSAVEVRFSILAH